jgi:hypothetical protein
MVGHASPANTCAPLRKGPPIVTKQTAGLSAECAQRRYTDEYPRDCMWICPLSPPPKRSQNLELTGFNRGGQQHIVAVRHCQPSLCLSARHAMESGNVSAALLEEAVECGRLWHPLLATATPAAGAAAPAQQAAAALTGGGGAARLLPLQRLC